MDNPSKPVEVSVAAELRLPMQAAPVDRTLSGMAALAASAGVEASFNWQSLLPVAKDIFSLF